MALGLLAQFQADGFAMLPSFAEPEDLASLCDAVASLPQSSRSGGDRNIQNKSQVINAYANSDKVIALVSELIGGNPKLARAIYFNKTSEQNWSVAWHQDKTVAVSSEVNTTGWASWSVKGGVSHAQPPSEVFNKMLTIRIHLDAANQTNGCLKVIPKSHSLGALSQADIPKHTAENNTVYCCANPGDALVMHPLLIHASGKATESTARRVLHLEYTNN